MHTGNPGRQECETFPYYLASELNGRPHSAISGGCVALPAGLLHGNSEAAPWFGGCINQSLWFVGFLKPPFWFSVCVYVSHSGSPNNSERAMRAAGEMCKGSGAARAL